MKKLILAGLLAAASAASQNAWSNSITLTGSGTGPGGVPVSASSIFDVSGDILTITLTNTSVSNTGKDVPGSTLTGLFWTFNNASTPTLIPVSALLAGGSSILGTCSLANCASITNLGGEFGYQATGLPHGADRGISSSGYLSSGLAGNIGNFNNGAAGVNLDGPASLNGINFGIISGAAGYNPNGGLAGIPVVQDTVVFRLSGATGVDVRSIVASYQYGTSLSDLNVLDQVPPATVPEPGTIALLGLGLAGIASLRRKSGRSYTSS
ncbi:PEP-CTERM sorting domain-containing protein [Janthinobacterium sp.]|uniref:PEP-CTERM sorting domain-containing protein n=1 Tax=Janthinobacterium sp. TaxID=1871054 RepID=UPI00293D2709|nr:PEP-CTERM sorting domain-containing protein [Janthinobacterium sp.]